jgi:hypothetical protein
MWQEKFELTAIPVFEKSTAVDAMPASLIQPGSNTPKGFWSANW